MAEHDDDDRNPPAPDEPGEDLLNTAAVARLLGVSGAYVREARKRRHLPLPFVRIDGEYRHREQDVLAWSEREDARQNLGTGMDLPGEFW